MKFGKTTFIIRGLNQEKILNKLSKKYRLSHIVRLEKSLSSFEVSYLKAKKVKKGLSNFEIVSEKSVGLLPSLVAFFTNIAILSATLLSLCVYMLQSPFILQFEVTGQEILTKNEIVSFVKSNYSLNKFKLTTSEVEQGIIENFDEISFVSVAIKGQTMIVNIKEKLLPDEIYGDFEAIYSKYDGKITKIEVVSGTVVVNVGDYVKAGDVLVYPYYYANDGEEHPVQAEAAITLETYTTANAVFYPEQIVVSRTGNYIEIDQLSLFDLLIYETSKNNNFSLYETEIIEKNFSKNLILPFIYRKIKIYELKEEIVTSEFDEEKIVEQARENTLEILENYDTIKEEYYTVKTSASISVVTYVIVCEVTIDGT